MTLGDSGALDYAINSAATVGEALQVAVRYMRLLSDALDFRLEISGDRAMARLDSRVPLPRAAADYQASGIHFSHLLAHAEAARVEWWFPHARPDESAEYDKTFGTTRVRFSAPCFAYVFDARYLATPIPTADPKLHAVMRSYAERVLADLPRLDI